MREFIIDTVGDNALKGAVCAAAWKENLPFKTIIEDSLVFYYKNYNQNLPPDRFAQDVCWLYDNGAKKVRIEHLK